MGQMAAKTGYVLRLASPGHGIGFRDGMHGLEAAATTMNGADRKAAKSELRAVAGEGARLAAIAARQGRHAVGRAPRKTTPPPSSGGYRRILGAGWLHCAARSKPSPSQAANLCKASTCFQTRKNYRIGEVPARREAVADDAGDSGH
jgi:hypothetical protein